MTKLLGLVGLKQHGKDTAADILVKRYGFSKKAFADLLKRICMEQFDLSHEQVYGDLKEVPDERWRDAKGNPRTPRFILQWLGSEGFRTIDPDFWVKAMLRDIPSNGKTVVCDVRFLNEAEAIIERGGEIWVVDMPGKPSSSSWKDYLLRRGAYHQSETFARKLVNAGRRGKFSYTLKDFGVLRTVSYVPFEYGEPEFNETVVETAWGSPHVAGELF
jgi:hypothetical protein